MQAPIDPCDTDMAYERLVECMKAFNKQARDLLGPLPIPESVRKILDLIAEQQVFPPADPQRPEIPEEIVFVVEDDLDEFDFNLDIKRWVATI